MPHLKDDAKRSPEKPNTEPDASPADEAARGVAGDGQGVESPPRPAPKPAKGSGTGFGSFES